MPISDKPEIGGGHSEPAAILRDARCARSSESDSIFASAPQALARRRESRRTLAIKNQASLLAMVFSKSLARRRFRPSQAKVRSITQRFGSGLNLPTFSDRVTIWIVHRPNAAIALGSSVAAWRAAVPRRDYPGC